MGTVVTRTYTDIDIEGKTTLTIDKLIDNDPNSEEVTEAIIDFGPNEVTVNIAAKEGRTTPLKVVINGLKLNGHIDIAMNDQNNELEYSGICNIVSQDTDSSPIHVKSGTKLEIYGGSDVARMDVLTCKFSSVGTAAGIGADYNVIEASGINNDAGEIIIEGKGVVNVTSRYGAAIGGSSKNTNGNVIGGAGGIITIGGTVEVHATSNTGAGIGGGYARSTSGSTGAGVGGAGGVISIGESADVYATSTSGAGIGGGLGYFQKTGSGRGTGVGGAGGTINIGESAKVYATSSYGAGIGGGYGDFNVTGTGIRGEGGAGGTITIVGIGTVEAQSTDADDIGGGIGAGNSGVKGREGDILIANPNIIVSNTNSDDRNPNLLTKTLLYSDGYIFKNRTIGLIEVDNLDQEINKYMTETDTNGALKYYYHNATAIDDKQFMFTNGYPNYKCKTDLIDKVISEDLKFPCERLLVRGVNLYI